MVNALTRWGDVQARRQGISRAQALGDSVYLVRYLTMSVVQFRRSVEGRGLLSRQEEHSVIFCLIRPDAWLPCRLDQARSELSTHRKYSKYLHQPRPFISWFTNHTNNTNSTNVNKTKHTKYDDRKVRPSRSLTCVEKVFVCLACVFD